MLGMLRAAAGTRCGVRFPEVAGRRGANLPTVRMTCEPHATRSTTQPLRHTSSIALALGYLLHSSIAAPPTDPTAGDGAGTGPNQDETRHGDCVGRNFRLKRNMLITVPTDYLSPKG